MRINIYVLLFFLLGFGSIQNGFSGKVFSRPSVPGSERSQEPSGDIGYLNSVVFPPAYSPSSVLPPAYSPSSYTEKIETYLYGTGLCKATEDDLCFYRGLGVTEEDLRHMDVIPSKQEFEGIKYYNPEFKLLAMKVIGPEGGDLEISSSDQVPPVVLKIPAGALIKKILIVALYKINPDGHALAGFFLPCYYPMKGVIRLPLENTDPRGKEWRFCEMKIDCLNDSGCLSK